MEGQTRVAVGFPKLTQNFQGPLRQRNEAIGITLAATNVQEHPVRNNVSHLQAPGCAQAQTTGIDRDQSAAVIGLDDFTQDAVHLAGRGHHRKLVFEIGSDQHKFRGPASAQGLFPENLDGTNGLGGALPGNLLIDLEMDAILPNLFGGDQFG